MHNAVVMARRLRGFSMAELLLAATLGALLVTAAASTAGSFSQTVAQLRSDVVDDYENVTARIARDVRYAWWAEVPAADHLRLADAAGEVTEYYLVGNSLLVRRPSGEEGSVITGLSGVTFEQTSMQRLREGNHHVVNGRIASVAAPPSATSSLSLVEGNALGLAIKLSSDAGPSAASSVEDRFLSRTPNSVDLLVACLGSGSLHGDIFAARAPGDARPRSGATSLGSFDVSLAALPAATILTPAVGGRFAQAAVYAIPAVSVPIGISDAQPLQPGVAYTLQLSVRGTGSALVTRYASLTGSNDAVMYRNALSDPWSSQSSVMAFSVSGSSVATTTTAADVASQIRLTLTPTGEPAHIASAAVFSQVLAEDPWLGVVPGESPPAP